LKLRGAAGFRRQGEQKRCCYYPLIGFGVARHGAVDSLLIPLYEIYFVPGDLGSIIYLNQGISINIEILLLCTAHFAWNCKYYGHNIEKTRSDSETGKVVKKFPASIPVEKLT
jgi:hypothetical protein